MHLTILGAPRTKKNSPRVFGRGNRKIVLPSEAYMHWHDSCAMPQLKAQWSGIEPLGHPFGVRALIYRDADRGDLNNYLQAVCDALEDAGVCTNDKWVQSFDGSRLRIDRSNPRCELYLVEINNP